MLGCILLNINKTSAFDVNFLPSDDELYNIVPGTSSLGIYTHDDANDLFPAVVTSLIDSQLERSQSLVQINHTPKTFELPEEATDPGTSSSGLKCHLCTYQATTDKHRDPVNSLSMHIARMHRGYLYTCKECSTNHKTLHQFVLHTQQEHPSAFNDMSCNKLKIYLKRNPDALRLLLTDAQQKAGNKIVCPFCYGSKKHKEWTDLSTFTKRHIKQHTPLNCHQCGKSFMKLRSWAVHCLDEKHLFNGKDYKRCLACDEEIIMSRYGCFDHLNHLLSHPVCFKAILDGTYNKDKK